MPHNTVPHTDWSEVLSLAQQRINEEEHATSLYHSGELNMPLQTRTDFHVINGGSVFLLHPITREAQDWADKNIQPDAQRYGSAIVIEHRYIVDIIDGIKADGLEVK